jgi:hypothetical protein
MRLLTLNEATFVSAGANSQEPLAAVGALLGGLYGAYVGFGLGAALGIITFAASGASPEGMILGGVIWVGTTIGCGVFGAVAMSLIGSLGGYIIDSATSKPAIAA